MKNRHIYVFVIAFLILLHSTYVLNGFVWLDHNDIEQKHTILSLPNLYKAFLTPFGQTSFYRPVLTIINSLDFAVYGDLPYGYHLTSLGLFAIYLGVVVKFAEECVQFPKKYSPLLLLLLGTHPVGILLKGVITYRQEVILSIFIFLFLIFYRRWLKVKQKKEAILTLFYFTAALFTKETSLLILPAMLIALELKHNLSNKLKFKANYKMYIVLVTITAIYLLLRFKSVGNNIQFGSKNLDIHTYLGLKGYLTLKILASFINPSFPKLSDAVNLLNIGTLHLILPCILLGGGLFCAYLSKTGRKVLFPFIILIIFLVPGLNFTYVPRIASLHYSFLPLATFVITVFKFILLQKKLLKSLLLTILTVFFLVSSVQTYLSGYQFKNDKTLFLTEVGKDKNFTEAYYYLGNYYLKIRDYAEAANYYSLALAERPNILSFIDKTSAKVNLATSLFQKGDIEQAEKLYLEILPSANESLKPLIIFNLALIENKKNNSEGVIRLLEGKEWKISEAYLLLAETYQKTNNRKREIETIKKALHIMPVQEKYKFEQYLKSLEKN